MSSNGPNPTGAPFELIDGYKVDRYISKGSYGEVYQATRTYYPSPKNSFLCGLQQAHNDEYNTDIAVIGSPTYINPNPELAAQQRGGMGMQQGSSAFAFYSGASGSTIPNAENNNNTNGHHMPSGAQQQKTAGGHHSRRGSQDFGGDNAAPAHAAGAANIVRQRSGGSPPPPGTGGLTINTNFSSAIPPALSNGAAAGGADNGPRTQRVAIKVIRDYARRGTNVQGSDRYVSRYTKKIAREVQLLQYFNGCKEFVPVLDMYLSTNKHDLYVIMKMFDYSLYTFVRHEVALKKQKEEEERMRASPTKKTRIDSSGQVVPVAPVRKGLRRIMDEKKTKMLTVQLLSGLAKMAAVGAAHRDLSSGNVLYDPKTHRISICDFGLSRANINAKMAQTTNVVTAPYRSPELLLLINKYDGEKVDVWSVGILMMEMLIGCPPVFEQNDNLQREGVFRNLCYCDMEYWRKLGAPSNLLENDRGRKFDHYNKYPKFIDRLANEAVLSPEGIAVLKACLEQRPEDRLRCKELLAMPWFQRDADAVRLIDELTAHADRDKAFQRRQLPNIEDGYTREDHIRWLEGVVPKVATMRQPCPTPPPKN